MTYRFTTEDVLDLIGSDGDYNDGIDAYVSVTFGDGTAVVELQTPENEDDSVPVVTERFRVTVERVAEED